MRHAALRRYFRHGMLPQLMVFEAVARLGSFTRAGEELCLAQPTVSVQIRKLSETLELPLFEQCGRKVELTDGGRELYAIGKESLLFSSRRRVRSHRNSACFTGSRPSHACSGAVDLTSFSETHHGNIWN